jgi:hypothetical protein
MSPSTPKKRGAPLGNRNALRHGAYARRQPLPPPGAASESAPRLSLAKEISYLRFYFFSLAFSAVHEADPSRIAAVVRTLSIAATALTRLIQTESWLAQTTGAQVQQDGLASALAQLDSFVQKSRRVGGDPDALEPGSLPEHPLPDALPAGGPLPESLLENVPLPESLLPGIDLLARQLGLSASELLSGVSFPAQGRTPAVPHA